MAWEAGFDFVDVNIVTDIWATNFSALYTREGGYGGSFETRTVFSGNCRGNHSLVPGLKIGVRLSASDTVPFVPIPMFRRRKNRDPESRSHISTCCLIAGVSA